MNYKCYMCSKKIGQNEHFFIVKGRILCRSCGKKFREKKNEVHSDSNGCDFGSIHSMGRDNEVAI